MLTLDVSPKLETTHITCQVSNSQSGVWDTSRPIREASLLISSISHLTALPLFSILHTALAGGKLPGDEADSTVLDSQA